MPAFWVSGTPEKALFGAMFSNFKTVISFNEVEIALKMEKQT